MSNEIASTYNDMLASLSVATTPRNFYLHQGRVLLALNAADADAENVYVHECAKVLVDKVAAQAWTAGQSIYWDNTAKNFTTTSTSNTLAGLVIEDAGSADATGYIHLSPFA